MEPLQSTESAKNAVARVNYTHDAMIDIIIAKPEVSGNELARHFGYSVGWVSRVICSDAFQARLAERRTEIVNPGLLATFEERLKGLAMQSLDILVEKLDVTKDAGIAMKALELTTKSLGYGARQTNVAVQTNFVVALPGKADDAEGWSKTYSSAVQLPA